MAARNSIEATGSSQYSSSSHTGSAQSDATKLSKKGADLSVDNTMSPIDLEGRIQTERIAAIIEDFVYKTKLVIALPHLVRDYTTLSCIMTQEHLDDLIVIFDQHESPYSSYTSLLNTTALEDIKAGEIKLKNRISPELTHLICILTKYPKLKIVVEEITKALKDCYSAAEVTFPPSLIYLETLEQFQELMLAHLDMSAAEDLEKKLRFRKVTRSNQHLIMKINDCLATTAIEKETFDKVMMQKMVLKASFEKELETLNNEITARIKKQVLDSERQMVLATRAHDIKLEILNEEETETCESYQNMLRGHLAEEKQMRARRFKAQTQLVSWLQKYDQEMSEKQSELEEMTRMYKDENEKIVKLEEELAEQDLTYIPEMAEREAEYQQEMANKMAVFMREHAARVIQYAWREVLFSRKEKKRLKKLAIKLAKQAEAEAARPKKKIK